MVKRAIRTRRRPPPTLEDFERPLTCEEAAELLSAGARRKAERVTADAIRAHLAAGAPGERGGKVRLDRYAAWLAGQVAGK